MGAFCRFNDTGIEGADMSITTEAAERLAIILNRLDMDRNAAALRSLAAERDALRAEVERSESGVSYETFVSGMQIVTTERDALRAENARLREALKECADDLEAEITHRYGDMVPKYPRERLKRDQDMAPVLKARAALGEKDNAEA
jgi:hypothetical protein